MGGKSSTSSSSVAIPPAVLAQYSAVNAAADQTAQTPFQQYSGQFVAPVNQTQATGIAGTTTAANEAQPYYGAATETLAGAQAATAPVNAAAEAGTAASAAPLTGSEINQYLSPYLGDVLESTEAVQNQENQQQQAGQLGDAITSGAFGSDRTGIAAANLEEQQNLANNQTISGIANTGYQSALSTAQGQQQIGLAGANQLASIGSTAYGEGANTANELGALGTGAQGAALSGANAEIQAGTVEQQTQQAQDTAEYNQFLQQQSYPFQVDQFLANIAEGTGALSGSTTTTTQPGGFFSDKRLKRDIKKIGKTFDGQDIYTYKMGDDNRTHIGLIAQEVEKKHPEAVGVAGGYKTVDYGKATNKAANQEHFNNGGVVAMPRKRFAIGGYSGAPDGLAGVLQAQQAMYGQMGGAGQPGMSGTPRVPAGTSGAGSHLAIANTGGIKPPQTGAQNVQQAAALVKTGKGLYNDFAKPSQPASAAGTGAPTSASVDTSNGVMGTGISPTGVAAATAGAAPVAADVSASAAGLGVADAAATDAVADAAASGLTDDALMFAKRGGRIGYDLGGTPYGSGTDSGDDLNIPDDPDTYSLKAAPATAPKPSEFQQLLGGIPVVGQFLENYGRANAARGGVAGNRRGYDDGGTPTADDTDDTDDATPAPEDTVPTAGVAPASSPSLWSKIKGAAESPGVLAALEGLGAMGTARTVHPGVALAAGLEAAAGAYAPTQEGLATAQLTQEQAQAADIANQVARAKANVAISALQQPSQPIAPQQQDQDDAGPPQNATAPQLDQYYKNKYFVNPAYSPQDLASIAAARTKDAALGWNVYTPQAQLDADKRIQSAQAQARISSQQEANDLYAQATDPNAPQPQRDAALARYNANWQFTGDSIEDKGGSLRISRTGLPPIGVAAQGLTPTQQNENYREAWAPVTIGNKLPQPAWMANNFQTPEAYLAARPKPTAQPGATAPSGQSGAPEPSPQGPAQAPYGAPPPVATGVGVAPPAGAATATQPQTARQGARTPAPASTLPTTGDPYFDHSLSTAAQNPEFRRYDGPTAVDQPTAKARMDQQTANVANRQNLIDTASSITQDQAQAQQFLMAAKQVMASKGAPTVGFPGYIRNYVGSKFNSVDASNYTEVSKYLVNAAAQQFKTNFPKATQSEFITQTQQMSPSTTMPPAALNDLINTGLRTSDYMLKSAKRADVWASTPGVDPQKFYDFNQTYYPRDKIVNADQVATNKKTGQRMYHIGGQWVN